MWRIVNEVEQQIIDGVARKGWFTITYVPGQGDPREWYSYTVGLSATASWPEVICFGYDADLAVGMLRNMIAECWARHERPADGLELNNIVEGRVARLERFDGPTKPYFLWAEWYAQRVGAPVTGEWLQLVWPDSEGRFPGDPNCDPRVQKLQTRRPSA